MASEREYLEAVEAKGDLNPSQKDSLARLRANSSYGDPGASGLATGNTINYNSSQGYDPLMAAQSFLNFQKKANEPVVQQLQGFKDTLTSKYDELVASIKGVGQTSTDYTTRATSSELGRRGLLPQSEEGQRVIGQALQPVTAQTENILSQTGLGEAQDLQNLALQIAQLQAGQPSEALSSAFNYGNLQNQALQLQQNNDQFNKDYTLKQQAASQPNIVSAQGGLYDTTNGKWVLQPKATGATSALTPLESIFGGNSGVTSSSSSGGQSANDFLRSLIQYGIGAQQ